MEAVQGLHHITVFASDPQANVDFYHRLLGQRLVKKTVNFDDPGTYHLYYGDKVGTPGTIMTYFPWPYAKRGVVGNGETGAVAYAIRPTSVAYWQARLQAHGVVLGASAARFGENIISFSDPDGMVIELIPTDNPATLAHWEDGPIPAEHALLGFHGVTLFVDSAAQTADVLTNIFGYINVAEDGARSRYAGASNDIGLYIDLVERPGEPRGQFGAGSIHHIAFRTRDDAEQVQYQAKIAAHGLGVTEVKDRQYFHSIYFREPNGVLFEVATDAPGFPYDEPIAELGTHLKLPSWLEPRRAMIEKMLPPVTLPEVTGE